MTREMLKANCSYCGKEVFSLYESQLKHNLEIHETWCPIRQKEERDKEK